MEISQYFSSIRRELSACPWVSSSNIRFDERTSQEGFVRGEIYFVDGSFLHVREYVDCESAPERRLTYAYQYLDANGAFVFRYDNTDHHRKLNLPTYPHHNSEETVIASPPPTLSQVLYEIGRRVKA